MKSLFDAETNLEKLFRKVHDKKWLAVFFEEQWPITSSPAGDREMNFENHRQGTTTL